jgi:signal transduction histidine kinase
MLNHRARGSLVVVSGVVVAATMLAVLEAVATDVADPWNRPTYGFAFALTRLLVPWLVLAGLCFGVVFLAERVRIGRATLGWSVPIHAIAVLWFPVVHLAIVAAVHTMLFREPDPLVDRIRAMLAEYAAQDVLAYCCVVGFVHARRSAREARERERHALELQANLAEARLAALRAQIHPHFLFNTLNTAVMLVRDGESAKAVDVLTDLSDLLRTVLRRPTHEIALGEEIELVRQYLRIEGERFHDRLRVRIDTQDSTCDALVPSLILQPLVENAIRHGIASRIDGGTVSVHARRTAGDLVLEVLDDGGGFPCDSTSRGSGIGLQNTRDRLRQLYGSRASCTIAGSDTGVTVRLVLPFHTARAMAHV